MYVHLLLDPEETNLLSGSLSVFRVQKRNSSLETHNYYESEWLL